MIGIINYKAGNAYSVLNAFNKISVNAKIVSTIEELENVSGIVLPGVGSAKYTMESLEELKIISTLENLVLNKKIPFLGICVGLQVLFDYSTEEDTKCLGWLKGNAEKFSKENLKVPQMGWNEVEFVNKSKITENTPDKSYFYFVNSYYVKPEDKNIIIGKTDYDIEFCSMIEKDNIFATQFHVEKSGQVGLNILKNFGKIVGGENVS